MDEPAPSPPRAPFLSPRARLALVALALVTLAVVGHVTHARERLSVPYLRSLVESAGTLGVVVFVLAFTAGELLQVPGLAFVGVAVVLWGKPAGGAIAYAASLVSIAASFLLVRQATGPALATIERPWVQRLLARLDRRPVLTIALLRTVLVLSPPLNYALALSRVRFRDYLVGSALGLVPPLVLAVVFFDALARFLPA